MARMAYEQGRDKMLFDMTKRLSYLDVGILHFLPSMAIVTLTHP
jgi:hypothetical protein